MGTLRPEVAAELGLPPEVVVAPGGGDNAMAALGSGAVREGTWVLSLGTSGGRLCCNNGDRQATSVLISFAGCGLPGQPTGLRNAWMWPHPEYFQRDINMMAVPTPSCAGTLFGPSTKAVLDPSGTICPFADAAGGWLPLLCTLNCTGVTEEVRLGLLRAQAVTGHHGLLCRGLFTHPVEGMAPCRIPGAAHVLHAAWGATWAVAGPAACPPPRAAHPPSMQVRLTVGKCLDHDSMTNEVRTYCAPIVALTS